MNKKQLIDALSMPKSEREALIQQQMAAEQAQREAQAQAQAMMQEQDPEQGVSHFGSGVATEPRSTDFEDEN